MYMGYKEKENIHSWTINDPYNNYVQTYHDKIRGDTLITFFYADYIYIFLKPSVFIISSNIIVLANKIG